MFGAGQTGCGESTESDQLDEEIDHQERDIESLCMKLLLQQQPVAKDLRLISAALKMITDMERIGDHASDISEMTILMADAAYETGDPINLDLIKGKWQKENNKYGDQECGCIRAERHGYGDTGHQRR